MGKSLLILCCLALSLPAWADSDSPLHPASLVQQQPAHQTNKIFEVTVRAIGASDSETFTVDPRLEELAPKLKRLPFGAYKLLSDTTEDIALLSRHKLSLSNGQSLCVRAVESSDNQITLWLKWKGGDGMSILDTRVNFALNEPMLVGIEGQSESAGTVLAISISPKS